MSTQSSPQDARGELDGQLFHFISANTFALWRKEQDKMVQLATKGDVNGLKKMCTHWCNLAFFDINKVFSSEGMADTVFLCLRASEVFTHRVMCAWLQGTLFSTLPYCTDAQTWRTCCCTWIVRQKQL